MLLNQNPPEELKPQKQMPFRLMSVVTINGAKDKNKLSLQHLGDGLNQSEQINIQLSNRSSKCSQRSHQRREKY